MDENNMGTQAIAPTQRSFVLNKWWMPFLWIILTPLVTVPLSEALFDSLAGYQAPGEAGLPAINDPDCLDFACVDYEYFELGIPTLIAFALPGLLNLVAFAWLVSTSRRVRTAAVVAGVLGVVRLMIPVIVLLSFDTVTNAAGRSYAVNPHSVLRDIYGTPEPFSAIWDQSALAWAASLVTWGAFRVLTRGSERVAGLRALLAVGGGLFVLIGLSRLDSLAFGLPLAVFGGALVYLSLRSLIPDRLGRREARQERPADGR
jgi:hypothetical protein